MVYETRRRKREPTLLLTQEIFNLPHHVGIVWEELDPPKREVDAQLIRLAISIQIAIEMDGDGPVDQKICMTKYSQNTINHVLLHLPMPPPAAKITTTSKTTDNHPARGGGNPLDEEWDNGSHL